MELKRRHVALASVAACVLHGMIAAAVFWTPLRSGAVGAGVGGLEVSLGAAGGAPGLASPVAPGEASEVPIDAADVARDALPMEVAPPLSTLTAVPVEPQQAVTETAALDAEVSAIAAVEPQVEQVPDQQPTGEVIPAVPRTPNLVEMAEAVAPVVPTVEAQSPQETAETIETAPTEEIEVAAVRPTEVVTATEAQAPPTVTAEPTEPDIVAAPLPRTRPRDVPPARRPTRTASRPKPQPEHQVRAETSSEPTRPEQARPRDEPLRQASRSGGDAAEDRRDSQGQGTSSASGDAQNTGQGQQARSGGNPGAKRDYMTRLAAILARHKRYPRRAQSRRQEGVGHLYFVVEANGAVGAMRLTKSTGHRLLDDEILDILGRIGRLPPIPDDVGVARLEIVVPVNFDLR